MLSDMRTDSRSDNMDTTRNSHQACVIDGLGVADYLPRFFAAVVLLNVHSFYEPLKQLIRGGISEGFIHGQNSRLITFVDGPADISEHETFDWGKAALCALDSWVDDTERDIKYNWSKDRRNSNKYGST